MTFSIIVVRNLVSGTQPQIPNGWTLVPESMSWFSVYPNGRDDASDCLHVRLQATSGTVGAFSVHATSPAAISRLKAFADASSRAWTIRELRSDNSVIANRIKNAWRDLSEQDSTTPVIGGSMLGFDYQGSSEVYGTLAALTGNIG